MTDVVSIGECMVELARGSDGRYGLAVGGDTFNTAVYLARAGTTVAYATRVGDDPYSSMIIDAASAEGVSSALIGRATGRMPGLYLIETSDRGERSFWYWRDRAPARELFESEDAGRVAAAMAACRLVYLSGITLSLYSAAGLDALEAALRASRANGAAIAMDGNYRPRGWAGDIARAQATFRRFWSLATIALPTFDDEQALWGDQSVGETIARLSDAGVGEIVVKQGSAGAQVVVGGDSATVPCPEVVDPVDTTAAGDSFNAGYLHARLAGRSAADAALLAHLLAGVVIRHRGAIAPRIETDRVLTA